MNTKNATKSLCSRCGSLLIELSKTIKPSGNPLYPITVTKYRCSNDPCQVEAEKKVLEAANQRLEREARSKKSQITFAKTT